MMFLITVLTFLHVAQPSGSDSDFELLTEERVSLLPQSEQNQWRAYLTRSNEWKTIEREVLAEECKSVKQEKSVSAPANGEQFDFDEKQEASWHSSDDARELAEVVMSFQTPAGGWSKSVDYSKGPRKAGMHWTSQSGQGWHYCGTLDNRSTTEQTMFLAAHYSATGNEPAKAATLRGLEWLLMAQYPNGGWPQNYPIESGYHEAITLNDNAMVHALEVLQLVSEAQAPFAFVDEEVKQRARAAYRRGISCLAAMQVQINGKRTVWCAQHDPLSLAPASARKKEPASLSGGESAELLKYLMRKGPTDAETVAMIEPALEWLEEHRITGLRKTKTASGRTDYVNDASSKEVYWARFYDLTSGQPIFAGADDGIIYATFSEMASKNKVSYDYFTTRPAELLSKELPRWRKRR